MHIIHTSGSAGAKLDYALSTFGPNVSRKQILQHCIKPIKKGKFPMAK